MGIRKRDTEKTTQMKTLIRVEVVGDTNKTEINERP
jgi:hypothetical protein